MFSPPPYSSVHLNEDNENEEPPEYEYSFEKPRIPVESDSFDKSFRVDHPKFNDGIFTIIFLTVVLLFIIITTLCFKDLTVNAPFLESVSQAYLTPTSDTSDKNKRDLILLALTTVGTPIICSMVALLLAYLFPMFFVFIGYFIIPLTFFSVATISFANGAALIGLLFFFLGILSLTFIYQNYSKLSFTALMLKIVIEVMRLHPSIPFVSFLGSISSGLIGLVYMFMTAIIYADRIRIDDRTCPTDDPENQPCVSATSTWIYIYVLFTGYYIFEVLKNLVHVTVSGVYGSWYFFEKSPLKPLHPAWGAFKRAVTYCFGSICFGSLIVSVIRAMRQILAVLQQKLAERRTHRGSSSDDFGANAFIYCILACIVSIFDFIFAQAEYWIKWFNQYAYSYMALYGKSYLASARDTFEIMKYKGIFILITDCLIGATLTFYSILTCVLSSGIFYAAIVGFQKNTNVAPEFIVGGFIVQLLLAYFITSVTLNSINSGFITFLVALCIEPEIFEANYHDYFVKMTNYYPEVSQSLKVPFPEGV
ncbi:hypothetical protein FOA43_003070 [Brettanomyces nanus]|uniref:Protein PNS1 n=1 Tax=Eeniella nana TaxID=13502 RepID=A0A875S1V7_EENNA|nr:uncharacterized protein FOA43_003070 [Brettanomyces nanus]QPG75711.1 hypothetical protein FOA43_003070 [Brettanomyces nanus]